MKRRCECNFPVAKLTGLVAMSFFSLPLDKKSLEEMNTDQSVLGEARSILRVSEPRESLLRGQPEKEPRLCPARMRDGPLCSWGQSCTPAPRREAAGLGGRRQALACRWSQKVPREGFGICCGWVFSCLPFFSFLFF